MMEYIAVRQRSSHDFLRIDLQHADSLPRTGVFRFDSKLRDEAVDAVWQEPSNHDKGVVLSICCQIGHQARGCRQSTHMQVHKRHIHRLGLFSMFDSDSSGV